MKSILSFLISILFIILKINIYTQTTTQMYVVGNAEFLPNELISTNIKDINGEVCAGIMIVSDLEGLTFQSNNGIVDKKSQPGKDLLYLSPSERVIEVYKFGYEPLRIILADLSINLKSGQVWQIKITGDKKLDLIPINIIVKPENSKVIIDSEEVFTNNAIKLSSGEHNISISKEGYKSISEVIHIDDENTLFNYELEKLSLVVVTIMSNPKGAIIYLNNNNEGITDNQVFKIPGTYELKLVKSNFKTHTEIVEISNTSENKFNIDLIKNSGVLFLDVYPDDSEIRINTQLKENERFELLPGFYEIEISKNGYLPIRETIELKRGETVNRKYELLKNSSSLTLNIYPPNCTVLINKKDYSNNSSIELAPGKYFLEVDKYGYNSFEEIINIQLGIPQKRNITLKKKAGQLQLKVNPIEANVRLLNDNSEISSWSGSKILNDLQIGVYSIEARMDGYETLSKKIIIEENKKTIENLVLTKNGNVQTENPEYNELNLNDYYVAAETMPQPIGGMEAIQQKIVYPQIARMAGVQGRVYIKAFVDEKGVVNNAKVIKGLGAGCDEAAIDAVLNTKFIPGTFEGKPAKIQVSFFILFKLN